MISRGDFSSLDYFQHESENHQLLAGFYVDRGTLLKCRTAKLLVRSGLSVNGTPVSLKRLEEIKLTITSTDLEGIPSTATTLFPVRRPRVDSRVSGPARLVSINFTLTAKVKKLSAGGEKSI